MRAGSSFTNFVTEGNVRQNAQDFNPLLYNKVGAITGYPGPNTGVAAAAGNPGPEIVPVMKGGKKVKKDKKTASKKSDKKKAARKTPKKVLSRSSKKTKKATKKSKNGMKGVRKTTRKYLKDIRGLFGLKGGAPATVPSGSQSSAYHQYMSNQPFSNSYSAGGHLAPLDNALANPVLIHPTDNCPPQK